MARQKKTHCKRGHPRTPENVSVERNCKPCARERASEWSKSNPKRKQVQAREWRENNPDRARAIRMANKFNMDVETIYSYLLERGDVTVCDICQLEEPSGRNLDIDHDHETNEIRGLLCSSCNNGLVRFKDSPERCRAAATYLEKHAQVQ